MAQVIKIKRSTDTAAPSSLENGELAYSAQSNTLYIGRPGGTTGDIDVIGGKAFIDKLNAAAPGTSGNAASYENLLVLRDASGSFVAKDLVLDGNLTVKGTTTTVNTEEINLADNILLLNSNHDPATQASQNAGLEIQRGNTAGTPEANVLIQWNEGTDRWEFTNDGTTYYNIPLPSEYNIFDVENVYDAVNTMVSNGTQTNITVTTDDAADSISFSVATATTGVNDTQGTLGLAKFNSAYFSTTNGWVDLLVVDGGVYSA